MLHLTLLSSCPPRLFFSRDFANPMRRIFSLFLLAVPQSSPQGSAVSIYFWGDSLPMILSSKRARDVTCSLASNGAHIVYFLTAGQDCLPKARQHQTQIALNVVQRKMFLAS